MQKNRRLTTQGRERLTMQGVDRLMCGCGFGEKGEIKKTKRNVDK